MNMVVMLNRDFIQPPFLNFSCSVPCFAHKNHPFWWRKMLKNGKVESPEEIQVNMEWRNRNWFHTPQCPMYVVHFFILLVLLASLFFFIFTFFNLNFDLNKYNSIFWFTTRFSRTNFLHWFTPFHSCLYGPIYYTRKYDDRI